MSNWEKYWVERGWNISVFGYVLSIMLIVVIFCESSYGKDLEMSDILYKQGNYGAICFPYKKSCSYTTKKCLAQCSDKHCDTTASNKVFEIFKDKNVSAMQLFYMIKQEMEDYEFTLLSWFDSGDCSARLTTKIGEVIKLLYDDGFSQIGFTRNQRLWEIINQFMEKDRDECKDVDYEFNDCKRKTRFMLTVERGTKIKDEGFYAIPDYKKQRVSIIHYHTFERAANKSVDEIIAKGEAFVRYCGGAYSYIEYKDVTEPELKAQCDASNSNAGTVILKEYGDWKTHEANCMYCLEEDLGCFDEEL